MTTDKLAILVIDHSQATTEYISCEIKTKPFQL